MSFMAPRSEKAKRKAFSLLKLPLTSRLILWYNPKPARMVSIGNAHSSWNANEQHSSAAPAGGYFTFQEEPMPKTKFQNVVFTAIMAICMVYGMIVYNVALNTGGVHAETFVLALHELYIMAPVAFVLEFFVVDGLAHKLAFTFMRPDDPAPVHQLRHLLLHLLRHVPRHEPDRHGAVQGAAQLRCLGADLGDEPPLRPAVAAVLLRALRAAGLPHPFPPEVKQKVPAGRYVQTGLSTAAKARVRLCGFFVWKRCSAHSQLRYFLM